MSIDQHCETRSKTVERSSSESANGASSEVLDAPLDALHCLSFREAEILKTVFEIVTIREFVNLKFMKCISALNALSAEIEVEKNKEENAILDDALMMTFPASDPTSVSSTIKRVEASL